MPARQRTAVGDAEKTHATDTYARAGAATRVPRDLPRDAAGTVTARNAAAGLTAGGRSDTVRIGRPRDRRRDDAIIAATLRALADNGFTGLSMESVAARAGVGKATVYRRWSTKEALVTDAIATLAATGDGVAEGAGDAVGGAAGDGGPAGPDRSVPSDGPVRERLLATLEDLRRQNDRTLAGRIMPRLLAERETHPDLFDTYRSRVITPARDRIADVLRRGIASGELRSDLDIDLATDVLIGPIAYPDHRSPAGGGAGCIDGVVDTVLRGIGQDRQRGPAPTPVAVSPPAVPGDAPSRRPRADARP
jgi:AcrR family transcriptional regulator